MEDTTTHYYYYYRVRSGGLHQQSAGYEAVTAMASVALCCAAWKCLVCVVNAWQIITALL